MFRVPFNNTHTRHGLLDAPTASKPGTRVVTRAHIYNRTICRQIHISLHIPLLHAIISSYKCNSVCTLPVACAHVRAIQCFVSTNSIQTTMQVQSCFTPPPALDPSHPLLLTLSFPILPLRSAEPRVIRQRDRLLEQPFQSCRLFRDKEPLRS